MIALRAILLLAALLSVHIATARAINTPDSQTNGNSNAKRFGVGIPVSDATVAEGQNPDQSSSELDRRFSFSATPPSHGKPGSDQIGIAGRGEKPARRFSVGGLTDKTNIDFQIGVADRDAPDAEQPGAERRVFVGASTDDFWHGAIGEHKGATKVQKEGLFSFAGLGAGVGIASTSIERAAGEAESEEQEKRFSFAGMGGRVGIAGMAEKRSAAAEEESARRDAGIAGTAEEHAKRFSFAGMGGRVGIAGIAEKRAAAAAAAEQASAKRAATPHPLD